MATILSILNRLEATTSRLEKEAILKQNADNMTLMRTFHMALDPKINFYIKQVPPPGPDVNDGWRWNLYDAYASMQTWLSGRKVRGHEATAWLARLLATLTPDDQEVIKRVLGRNLKCGVSEATAEKIWPDLKLSYPCMLVSPLNDKTKIKFPCIAQTKMDGMRFNAHVQYGQVVFKSRAGKELDLSGLPIEADFKQLPPAVYDGELLVANCDRKTGNGILTKFQKGTGKASDGQNIHARLWDIIGTAPFEKGTWAVPYSERFDMLSLWMNAASTKTMDLVPSYTVTSMEEAQELYQKKLAEGEEGLVLKDPKGLWEDKRVKHQVKMKAELEADLRVTGFLPGSGKYEGKIGSLLVESADGKVKSAVGTGLDDEERSRDPSEFVGQIVAVKYNALIDDKKTGLKSLFLPVFVEVRSDKAAADNFP
jgi:ATP-dependent DNA ligase